MGHLPERVTIGPYEYIVSLEEHIIIGQRTGYQGAQDEEGLAIKIRHDLHPIAKESTLVHEIIHALLTSAGIRGAELPAGTDVETLVERLEMPMYMFLRDNTDFFNQVDDVKVIPKST